VRRATLFGFVAAVAISGCLPQTSRSSGVIDPEANALRPAFQPELVHARQVALVRGPTEAWSSSWLPFDSRSCTTVTRDSTANVEKAATAPT
jgi:hypothetical protein